MLPAHTTHPKPTYLPYCTPPSQSPYSLGDPSVATQGNRPMATQPSPAPVTIRTTLQREAATRYRATYNNTPNVVRSYVRKWLSANASPQTLITLAEDLANAEADGKDRNMVNRLILEHERN